MDSTRNRIEALSAYQAILQQHGYAMAAVYKRTHIARCLIQHMDANLPPGDAFRAAVDAVLPTMPDSPSRDLCVLVAREFYPFLISNIKAIAFMAATDGYRAKEAPPGQPGPRSIDEAIQAAEASPMDETELSVHTQYIQHLAAAGLKDSAIVNRTRIARLLMFSTRGVTRSGASYRAAIDRLVPLFTKEDTRTYFLAVAREFYVFLTGKPGEPSRRMPPDASGVVSGTR